MPTSVSVREDDPLLKDLSEKKQSFRRNVVSLATELKEARTRLAEQERSCSKEAMSRMEAETRVKRMEDEMLKLGKELNKKVEQIRASDVATEKYVKELGDIKSQLAATHATAEASALSAESVQSQCRLLSKQLHERTGSLKDHEDQVTRLGEQLDNLQKELQAREISQKQLRDDILKVEGDIMRAVSVVKTKENFEVRKSLDEDSPKKFERINKLLTAKDDEIARLRDELKIISAHWRFKTKELEDQVENQRRIDQELKKKVLKLEFCLRETRIQTRKLQKMGERNDVAIKELKEQLAAKKQHEADLSSNQNLWDKSGFKIVVSMSMLILVAFSRR
ncbi:PREDICTED: myosin heavy chain, cardiac muscle isoform-like [Camelina sativa]|uniref:Myosin heavy chain, cardiac muscle isoform-like n=1 Tax=Camelina sativa TaxID=90675 RepID=A0ABM0XRU9_CAMSA|nr:PREDICTED: myosin heavy chain, cardiac muscle isoform-like [Camelina sativa]XP_010490032.1 PREDICTED: myosin heavy chain, cardiac muscle isoform-like [Camelina sativa]XP_010490037.1 PREDICTED: myosin heavy chain, cardiac muscle isoform-like [Camelina sativa]